MSTCYFCGKEYPTVRAVGYHLSLRHKERLVFDSIRDRDPRWQRSTCCQGCSLELGSERAIRAHAYVVHDGRWNEVDIPPKLTIVEEPG